MEKMMGRASNPLRSILSKLLKKLQKISMLLQFTKSLIAFIGLCNSLYTDYASENFLQNELDLWYILTVMGTNDKTGDVEMRGFYIGNDIKCYNMACDLSLKVNFTMLEKEPKKIIVHLDKDEFQ
jgi:hypothetical protein